MLTRLPHDEICPSCRAVNYGNATCRVCVAQWTRFGVAQATVDRLLEAIGDRMPEAPMGTRFH